MKKILFILTILSVFILSGCNKKNNSEESSNSDSTTEVDNTNNTNNDESPNEGENDDSVYDDGIDDWGPWHK